MTERAREVLADAVEKAGDPLNAKAIREGYLRYSDRIALAAMSTYAAEREAAERKRAATIADDYCAEKKYPSITELGDRIRTPEASAPQPMAGEIDHRPECELYGISHFGLCTCDFDSRMKERQRVASLPKAVPSQPDTGTKDWRDVDALIADLDETGPKVFGWGAMQILIPHNEAASLIALLAKCKDALQRLSKGKNDDR